MNANEYVERLNRFGLTTKQAWRLVGMIALGLLLIAHVAIWIAFNIIYFHKPPQAALNLMEFLLSILFVILFFLGKRALRFVLHGD